MASAVYQGKFIASVLTLCMVSGTVSQMSAAGSGGNSLDFVKKIWDNIAGFFGIASPSKLFKKELGFNLVYGLAEGVEDKVKTAVDAVNSLGQSVMTAAQKSLTVNPDVGSIEAAPQSGTVVNNYYNNDNSRTINQTNNSPKALTRLEIYRQTRNAINV